MSGAGFQRIVIVILLTIATMITRFLPFLIFPAGKKVPDFVEYLDQRFGISTSDAFVKVKECIGKLTSFLQNNKN